MNTMRSRCRGAGSQRVSEFHAAQALHHQIAVEQIDRVVAVGQPFERLLGLGLRGDLIAVNATTGDIAWRAPLGITEQFPAGKKRTGPLNVDGP
jgi:hypothetical protein